MSSFSYVVPNDSMAISYFRQSETLENHLGFGISVPLRQWTQQLIHLFFVYKNSRVSCESSL